MFTLEDDRLEISIHPKGAELQRIFHKEHQLNYLWGGDPAFWGKHSPLLFPIVGTLKDNTYIYKDTSYHLPRHGFARDREFALEHRTANEIRFILRSDESTLAVYPFPFELRVGYRLGFAGLETTYRVDNPAGTPMYFSIGGHPAFNVPLAPSTAYDDYYLEFDETETTPRWPISKDGLIEAAPVPLLKDTHTLPLTRDLFARDALVFKRLVSNGVSLRSGKTERGLRLEFPEFPFLGIWAAPGANFVCIEPWCGIADGVGSDQQLVNKPGIIHIGGGGVFERTWTLRLF